MSVGGTRRGGREELVHRNQKEGRLRFTTDVAQAVARAKVVFLAVGTPPGEAELTQVLAAAEAGAVKHYTVVATKSTSSSSSASCTRRSSAPSGRSCSWTRARPRW